MENWYVPITLLPSVGFFIVAATSVSNSLSAEIARLLELEKEEDKKIISLKVRQLRLVSISLVLLYAGAILLAVSGLLGGVESSYMLHANPLIEILIWVGISAVILALGILMVYSVRAVQIKEQQFRSM